MISLSLPGLVCLGYLCLAASRLPREEPEFFQSLYILLALGLLVNYSLLLIFRDLDVATAVSAGGAGLGLILAVSRGRWLRGIRFSWLRAGLLAYLAALYGLRIISFPIEGWDPRSIWFFHAKIIFFHGALDSGAGWNDPAIDFSHVDYPKLLAGLAAQVAHGAGYWNEYLPKWALVLLLFPALAAVVSILKRRLSSVLLFGLIFFGLSLWLWNGYMDGPLALYSAMAVIFMGQWFSHHRTDDLLAGLVSVGVIANLKNEGSMLILAMAVAAATLYFFHAHRRATLVLPKNLIGKLGFLIMVFSGFFIWTCLKRSWGLQSDLVFDAGAGARLLERISDPAAVKQILSTLLVRSRLYVSLIFAAIAALGAVLFVRRPGRAGLFPLLTLSVYFCGLFCVYCLTPYELAWHIRNSTDRTVLPLLALSYCLSYFVLSEVEEYFDRWPTHPRTDG